MLKIKRVVITTILGLISGCISGYIVSLVGMIIMLDSLAKAGKGDPSLFAGLTWTIITSHLKIILFHGLFGFAIGVNHLRWHWARRGLVLGGIFGVIMGLVGFRPLFRGLSGFFVLALCLGLVYGFLIELITTVVFKEGIVISEKA